MPKKIECLFGINITDNTTVTPARINFFPKHTVGDNINSYCSCINDSTHYDSQFSSFRLLSASLAAMIQQQTEDFHIPCLQQTCSTIRQSRQQIMTSSLANIKSHVDP